MVIDDVIAYLKDPEKRKISPGRAKQALEIRKCCI